MGTNGRLARSELAPLTRYPAILLIPGAARAFDALELAVYRECGVWIGAAEGYRTLETQESYFFGRYKRVTYRTGLWYDGSYWVKQAPNISAAAIPTTSKHGDGRAVDCRVYSFDSTVYKVLARLAPLYGFSMSQGLWDREPWHIVYVGGGTLELAGAYTPIQIPTPVEDDLMATPEQRAALITELLNHAAFDKGPTVSEVLKGVARGGQFIRIQAPGKGIALIGPGYFRGLAPGEELEQSDVLISAHWTGNDRQFDLWKSLALAGVAASPTALPAVTLTDAQIAAVTSRLQVALASEVDGLDTADVQQIADAVADTLGRRITGDQEN